MADSVRKETLYGNYGEVYEDGKRGYATDSALFVDWSEEDWLYMHADTLFTEEVPYQLPLVVALDSTRRDSIAMTPDTLWKDTSYQRVRAYYGVRVYRQDMQMVCDSLVYVSRDSVMSLCGGPICWSDENQVSADSMFVYMRNGGVDYAHGIGNALAVKQEDVDKFDQMAGKEMYAYVRGGELRQVDVNGNAETVFFPQEDDGSFIGMNKTQSSYVKIYLEEKKVHHIVFTATTTGSLYPLDSIASGGDRLGGFFWADAVRPKYPGDVFIKTDRNMIQVAAPAEQAEQAEEPKMPDNKDARKGKGHKPTSKDTNKLKR